MCSTSVWLCTLAWENKQTQQWGEKVEVLRNKPTVFRIFEILLCAAAEAKWLARSEKVLG